MLIEIPEKIIRILGVSILVSPIVMMIIEKIKESSLITKEFRSGILNFIFSFIFGIPFSIYFFKFTLMDSIWVSIFSVIGASSIYNLLNKNYTPIEKDIIEIERSDKWYI